MDETKSGLGMSVAIVIAAIIIGGAIVYTNKGEVKKPVTTTPAIEQEKEQGGKIVPIASTDHIRGNINAKVKLVEYSDTECPFCKRLHLTFKQITKEYGADVAWLYRHMPIAALHEKALNEANATECVAELAGEEKFWTYLDRIYEVTPGNDGLDPKTLVTLAKEVGVDEKIFSECLASGKYTQKIMAQKADGVQASGKEGTPFTAIITPEGEQIPVSGAYPIETWRSVLDQILKK